jgi:uncharacterized short protein YbdD (DUF466 family)
VINVRAWFSNTWALLRRLTGDDAYERYLAHCRSVHGEDYTPLDRAAYYEAELAHRWQGVNRCC